MNARPIPDTTARDARPAAVDRLLVAAVGLLCVVACVFAIWPLYRAGFLFEIDVNEGWNAYHARTARLDPWRLYPAADSLVTNNYPPLSFLLIGWIAPFFSNELFAGRAVNFASLLAITVAVYAIARTLAIGRLWAVAAAAMLFGTMVGNFQRYAALNDPEMLAHAVMTFGLLLFLRARARQARWFVVPVATMVAAGFVKSSIFAFPLAAFAVLLIEDRRAALRFAVTGIGCMAVGFASCLAAYGPDFVANLTVPRVYGLGFLPRGLEHTHRAAAGLVAWIVYALHARDGARARLIHALTLAGLAEFVAGRLGEGVDYNVMFDLVIAGCLAFGALLDVASDTSLGRRWGGDRVRLVLILAVCLRIASSDRNPSVQLLFDSDLRARLAAAEQTSMRLVARVAAIEGVVVCARPLICFLAGRPFLVDRFNTNQRIRTGRLPPDAERAHFGATPVTVIEDEPSLRFVRR